MDHQQPKKMTIKTVAEILEVSSATVSNAFNRPDQLSAGLRKHILAECDKLGYHGPNPAARSLRTGKTGILGVLLADRLAYNFNDPCALEFLKGLSEVLDNAKVNMLLMPGRKDFYMDNSLEAIPDQYIIYGPPDDFDLIPRIEKQRKPIITVDFSLPGHLSLNIDNYGGAKQAAIRALTQSQGSLAIIGLKLCDSDATSRIGTQSLFNSNMSISIQRLEAYRDAAKEFKRPIPDDLIWSAHESTWQAGVVAAREALAVNPRPEALICMSDRLAVAAISVAREKNISIPEQLKIIGFDDTPEASQHHPSLTTVYQPSIEKGRLAGMMALQPDRYSSRTLPTSLIIRETC